MMGFEVLAAGELITMLDVSGEDNCCVKQHIAYLHMYNIMNVIGYQRGVINCSQRNTQSRTSARMQTIGATATLHIAISLQNTKCLAAFVVQPTCQLVAREVHFLDT